MNKKQLHEFSQEELLKLLEESEKDPIDKTDVDEQEDSILAFINRYKIKSGKERIKKSTLYQLYRNSIKRPLNYMNFVKEANKYIDNKCGIYYINLNNLDISKEIRDRLKASTKNVSKKVSHKNLALFIKEYNITKGSEWVSEYALEATVTQFIRLYKKRINRKFWLTSMTKLFDYKYKDNRYYFKLNGEKLRASYEEKKKRQCEISSTRS